MVPPLSAQRLYVLPPLRKYHAEQTSLAAHGSAPDRPEIRHGLRRRSHGRLTRHGRLSYVPHVLSRAVSNGRLARGEHRVQRGGVSHPRNTLDVSLIFCVKVLVSEVCAGIGLGHSDLRLIRLTSLYAALLYAYTPEAFPAPIRGSASGMLSTLGRISGIVSPSYLRQTSVTDFDRRSPPSLRVM